MITGMGHPAGLCSCDCRGYPAAFWQAMVGGGGASSRFMVDGETSNKDVLVLQPPPEPELYPLEAGWTAVSQTWQGRSPVMVRGHC